MSTIENRNLSHLANIVKIARSDGEVASEENELLIKIAKKYNITDEQFYKILKDPDSVPSLAQLELEDRIERLYELLEMVEADRNIELAEVKMMRQIVEGLAFPYNTIDKVVRESLKTDLGVTDLERFKRDIYKLLKVK